jgi:hypothetical protein
MARTSVLLRSIHQNHKNGAGTNYVVKTSGGDLYMVFIDQNGNVAYSKSTDGLEWGAAVVINSATTTVQLSVWFDAWSGISDGLIHCAYISTAVDDVLYRTLDTDTDSLSTETVAFTGGSAVAASGSLSICRARGGNVVCIFDIDGGTEHNASKLVNANVPNGAWADIATPTEGAAADYMILMPGWAADNQDMMCFFWDASADEISRKLYDDSADSWAETSIAATMVETATTQPQPNFAATVDTTNSRNLLVAWTAVDLLNADLRCWHVTESAITEVTNVVANSTDDQGLCAIGIDTATQDWYVFYGGESGGSETFPATTSINYKVSTDDGSTWGSETPLSANPLAFSTYGYLYANPRASGFPELGFVMTGSGTNAPLLINVEIQTAATSGGRAIPINNPSLVG